MQQSPTFNLRLQELKEGNPTHDTISQDNSFHHIANITKKLRIEWETTGCKHSFLYSELVDFDFDPNPELNKMTLYFAKRTVTLKGYHLDFLYDSFNLDEPYIIVVSAKRYAALNEPGQFLVTEAEVS